MCFRCPRNSAGKLGSGRVRAVGVTLDNFQDVMVELIEFYGDAKVFCKVFECAHWFWMTPKYGMRPVIACWMYEHGNSVLESEDGETVIISEEEMKRCHVIGKNWIKTSKEDDGEHDKITVAALKALCKVYKLDATGLKNTLEDRLDAHDGHQWKYGKPKAVKPRTKIGQFSELKGKVIQPPRTRAKIGQMNAKGKVIQPRSKIGQMHTTDTAVVNFLELRPQP